MSQLGDLGFRATHRAAKPQRARGCIAVLIALAVIVGAGWFVTVKGQDMLSNLFVVPDYKGTGKQPIVVQVHKGDATSDIADTLEQEDVVKSAQAFTRAAREDSRALSIQPGFYRLRTQMSGRAALGLILDPTARVQDRVGIQEGLRMSRAVEELAEGTGIAKSDFEAVLSDPEVLDLPAYAEDDPEGFLFPATYDVDPGTTAESLLRRMVERFGEEADRVRLVQGAEKLDYSPREIVTIASLVAAEVRQPADYPKVARVIYNRLEEGQKLQMDSTVHYATGKDGKVTTTDEARGTESPYNTYHAEGLPPGPINAPGKRALQAALDPAEGDWKYFVTVDLESGETKFAETLAQHQENVDEFQRWCQSHSGRC